jgi:hypothetical protein
VLISYATQTIQPDGTPDPASPVAAGMIAFAASDVPAGRSLAWSIVRGEDSQGGTLTPDTSGAVAATVALSAALAPYAVEMGAASWDDGSPPCHAGSGATTVTLDYA